ncbi:hypothetical protein VTL71DRAFT_14752 [Oculimacula yallundae]|uniref:Uncharacterized protein n=1 Tax=Oculimacula yallundae TaxID=86028 RepID=A0ABR4CJC8_9HELO
MPPMSTKVPRVTKPKAKSPDITKVQTSSHATRSARSTKLYEVDSPKGFSSLDTETDENSRPTGMKSVQPVYEGNSATTTPLTLSRIEAVETTSTATTIDRYIHNELGDWGRFATVGHTIRRPNDDSINDTSGLDMDMAGDEACAGVITLRVPPAFDNHWSTFEMPENRFEDDLIVMQTHRWDLMGELCEIITGSPHNTDVRKAVQENIWAYFGTDEYHSIN